MPDDPFVGLFERGFEIDSPGGEHETNARRLAHLGLVSAREHTYVRCSNTLDSDYYEASAWCTGRVYLDRDRAEYECPECGREIRPALKRQFSSMRLYPEIDAMRQFVFERIASSFPKVEERPAGVFRIAMASDDAMVLLIDALEEKSSFPEVCQCRNRVLLVTGRRPVGPYLGSHARRFGLAEIALGEAGDLFLRTLRRLGGRVIAAPAPFGPTIFARGDERLVLTIASNTNQELSSAPAPAVNLRVRSGTRWSQVTFYLVDGETIAMRASSGERLQRFHHYDVGMADRRNDRPNKKWRILEGLCENHGDIDWRNYAKTFGAFKEQVSGLRHALQTAFGIHADPFKYCTKRAGLSAAFQALPELPSGARYDESSAI